MIIISHRRNTVADLAATPDCYGIEVDIRSRGDDLYIHHDAFASGENFETWLAAFHHKTLILNVKEEGLETRLLGLMKARGIEDFFFLDQSFPFLIKTARAGEKRCAVRVSEFETVDTALSLKGMVDWVWVDCFNSGIWMSADDAARLRDGGFRLCLVSPELQGRLAPEEIDRVRDVLNARHITLDAVCTKIPKRWE